MKRSDNIDELSKALTAFQKNVPPIPKDKVAQIGTYSYKYADLATIWEKIRGILADNKLAIIQSPSSWQSEQTLTTMIAHETGQWVEDTMALKIVQETPQGQGSAITYARRYALTAMLGLVADDDTDAADHKTISPIQKKKLFDTAKRVLPELGEDPLAMVRFLNEIVGKHPSRILADEFDDAINSVETYTSKQVDNES